MAVTAAIAGGATLYQLASGIADKQRGKGILNSLGEREAYKTPDAVMGATKVARNLSQEGVPQAAINQQRQLLERQQTSALRNMGSRKAGLAGLTAVNQSLADQYTQMATNDANARLQNQMNYQNQLNTLGQYQEKELLDRQNNYDVARAEALGMISGGQQRLDSGMQSAVNVSSLLGGSEEREFEFPLMTNMTPISNAVVSSQGGAPLASQMGLQTNPTPVPKQPPYNSSYNTGPIAR